jgi:murein DD-endopeptidase MepM/ murein hydrolase activator NlpD
VVGTFYLDRLGGADAENPPESSQQKPEEHGSVPDDGRLAIPVLGASAADLVDTFDDSRSGRQHEAIDIMAPAGTPVIAAGPGTIEKLYQSDAGGNTIYLRSIDRRTIHYYAHLRSYEPALREGQAVVRGQRLGTVGSTGNADPSAPHLHFAILRTRPEAQWWESAAAANPYPLLNR